MNIDYMDIKAGMVIDGEETLMKHYNIFIQLQVVKQWGSCGNIVYHGEEVISVNFKLPVTLTTFFGGITTHNYSGETTNGIYLARISKTAGSTNVSEFDVHYKDMLTHYYYGPMFVVVIGK